MPQECRSAHAAKSEGALVGSLVLNRFLIERRIGSGGFGIVYEAWDGRLERPVAVKAIESRGEAGSAACCARRRRRRASTTPASSPSTRWARRTATPCSSPSWSTARPWPSSAATATLSDREIGEIGADLCEALDHAHSRGVVHRDIKPQNVLVTEEGEPRAKLMDFGVARLTDAAALTAPGDVVGTLAYMAPEQAEGRAAGPEADVYSLALTLYECWSGREPEPPRDPGRDGPGDRRPRPSAAPAAPRPAPRADRDGRRLPRSPPRPPPVAGGAGRRDRGLPRRPRRPARRASAARCRLGAVAPRRRPRRLARRRPRRRCSR